MGANDITEEITDDKTEETTEVEEIKLSKDEYEKLISDSKNYKASSSEAQKLAAFKEVHQDNTKFYKYFETDKAKAQYIAEAYGYGNANDLKAYLDDYYKEHPEERKGYTEDEIIEKLEAKQEEKEAKKVLNSFFKEMDVKKESKIGKAILEEFNDMMEGKKWTTENVEKYSEKALQIVKNTGDFAEEFNKAKRAISGAV